MPIIKNLFFIVVPLILFAPAYGATAEFETRCEQGVKQIASAWGTPAMNAHLAEELAADAEQFGNVDGASRAAPILEVVSVSDFRRVDENTCDTAVILRFSRAEEDHSLTAVSPQFGGRWTVRLPSIQQSAGGADHFNPVQEEGFKGVAMLRIFWELPPDTRKNFLADPVTENKFTAVENDENAVQYPLQPASGWLIRIGDVTTMTESDGSFRFKELPEDIETGEVVNPGTGVVFKKFSVDDLVAGNAEITKPIVVEMDSHGDCGMDGDNPAHCGM